MTRLKSLLTPAAGHRLLTELLVLGLTAISGVATATGLNAFMAHKGIVGGDAALALSVALTLLVMGGMLKVLREIRFAAAAAQKAIWATALVILMTTSISYGFGFYWALFRSGDVGQALYAAGRLQVIADIGRLRESIRATDARLNMLAAYSRQTMEEERSAGGTCDSSFAGDRLKGDGPRRRLRNRDAEVFAAQAREFREKAVRLDRVLADAMALAGSAPTGAAAKAAEALNMKVIEASNLVSTLPLSHLARRLDERIQAGRAGLTDPKVGAFQCPDARLEELMTMVRGSLDLPAVSSVVLPETDGREGIYFAIERLFNSAVFAAARLAGVEDVAQPAATGAPNRLERGDIVPLLLACTIDFLIVLLSFAKRRVALLGLREEMEAAPMLPGGKLGRVWAALSEDDASVLHALRPFLYYEFGKPMVAVPLIGDGGAQAALALMELLRDAGDATLESRPATWVRWHLARVGSAHKAARGFLVFRLEDGVLARLIKQSMQEALGEAGATAPEPGESNVVGLRSGRPA